MKTNKGNLLLLILVFIAHFSHSQQWIDKQYAYDSTLNIQYGSSINFNGTSTDLLMDVYTPKCNNIGESSNWPLLIFVHGGAFVEGSKDDASIQQLCKAFAKRGYVTASVSYRLGFVSDDVAWNCNYPNYECVFATDSLEWSRAYYRGVQDVKGAVRYLVNRQQLFSIDTNNVFLAGESAGSFIAMGVGLMDDESERPFGTNAIADAPVPNANALGCSYNVNETFSGPVARPDLGAISGSIEPSTVDYTIKGIGNFYGAMMGDLLQLSDPSKPKPAIYSFHRPCDMIVPIGSKQALWGLDWCMTNGYGCSAIANTPIVHGSKTFSDWNTNNSYGYTIEDHFTSINFPYSYILGAGSCLDQVGNPCHAYDSKALREGELATFFAGYVSSGQICQTAGLNAQENFIEVYPNPASTLINITTSIQSNAQVEIYNAIGELQSIRQLEASPNPSFNIEKLSNGYYFSKITFQNGTSFYFQFVKK